MNTEITLPVPELKSALSGLNKLVGKKTTLPVLSHVRLSRHKNGVVTLQGSDLDAHATFTFVNQQAGEVVDVLVPLEQLNKAFKCSGSKDEVALVLEGKTTKLRYSIGGSPVHQPVNTLPVDEWPPIPELTVEGSRLETGFGQALKEAMQCCSEDQSRQTLRGACLDATDQKAHYVVGTNGRFLYSANSFTFPLKETVIIPDSKFINGSGLLDDEPCFLSVQPGKKPSDTKHISLTNKQWRFVTRVIEGKYPNWKQVIPTINGSWTVVKLNPPAIEHMLKVIPNLPGQDGITNTVKLRTGQSAIWVEGKNKDDADWTKVAISDVTISGKAREICVNRDYLIPALKFGLDEMAMLDELSPVVMSREGKRMVIMPVSIKDPQTAKPDSAAPSTQPQTQSNPEPSPAEERKTDMTKTQTKLEQTKPAETKPSIIDQVDLIKETLKTVIRDLNTLVDSVKQAEKDQRATEKEVESARATLKKLQQVSI